MEELLAKLRELQQQQQQLNEQMAERQQSRNSASEQAGEQGQQNLGEQTGGQQSEGQNEGQQQQGNDGEQLAQGDKDDSRSDSGGDDEQIAAGDDSDERLSEDQEKLGQRSSDAAEEATELRIGRERSQDKSDVAAELRRAAEFQGNAARSISARRFAIAMRSGSEGAASIAEAIARLEDLVYAGSTGRHEADSFPPGYEQLIQEYLRAISYE